MTQNEIAAEVARRVSTVTVAELAERMDCSMMDARMALEAEAVSAVTGRPLDYHADWRNA